MAAIAAGPVQVKGYTKKDGTYVAPHTRALPNTSARTDPPTVVYRTEPRTEPRTAPPPGKVVTEDVKPVASEVKPEPTLPVVTLTPPRDGSILLGSSALILTESGKQPDLRAGWVKDGKLLELTAPAEVGVIERGRTTTRVKLDGKEWAVGSDWVPAK